jgi:uncharacterized protein
MKLAILSDSHDNIWKLEAAYPVLKSADVIIHCGDLSAPFMIRYLAEGVGDIPVHIVWGNNDGDKALISKVAEGYPNVHLHGDLAELEIDGLRIAVNHYPEIAEELAGSGKYDLVCYGHDHTAAQSKLDQCLLINPGELMGMKGRSTVALVETGDSSVEMVEIVSLSGS